MPGTQLKEEVHNLSDKLQAVLGYLELNQPDKALLSAKAAAALVYQVGVEIRARTLTAAADAQELLRMIEEMGIRARRLGEEVTHLQRLSAEVDTHERRKGAAR